MYYINSVRFEEMKSFRVRIMCNFIKQQYRRTYNLKNNLSTNDCSDSVVWIKKPT